MSEHGSYEKVIQLLQERIDRIGRLGDVYGFPERDQVAAKQIFLSIISSLEAEIEREIHEEERRA